VISVQAMLTARLGLASRVSAPLGSAAPIIAGMPTKAAATMAIMPPPLKIRLAQVFLSESSSGGTVALRRLNELLRPEVSSLSILIQKLPAYSSASISEAV
jgi:hypothetical protein